MYINRDNKISLFDFLFETGSSAKVSFDFSDENDYPCFVRNFNLQDFLINLDSDYDLLFERFIKQPLQNELNDKSKSYIYFNCEEIINSAKNMQELKEYRKKDELLGTNTKIESDLIEYIYSKLLSSYLLSYYAAMKRIFVFILMSNDNPFSFFNKLKKNNKKLKTIYFVVLSILEFISSSCDDAFFFYSLDEVKFKEKINSNIFSHFAQSELNAKNISKEDKQIIENVLFNFSLFIQDFLLKSVKFTKKHYVSTYYFDSSFFKENSTQNLLFGLDIGFNNLSKTNFNIFTSFECKNYDIIYNILNNNEINVSVKDNDTGNIFNFDPAEQAFVNERSSSSDTQLLFLSHAWFNKYFVDYKYKLINSLTENNLDTIIF